MDSQTLGEFSGTRRRKEAKVSILFGSLFIQWIPVLPSKIARTMYCYQMTPPSTSTTSGTLTTCTPSSTVDWFREESVKRDRQSVFFTAVNPIDIQDPGEVQYDLDKPRIAVYKNTWRVHQNTVFWCNLKLSQRRIAVLSNTIPHNRSFQHLTCDVYWERGIHEDWKGLNLQSIPIPEVTASRTQAEFATWTSGSF